ncbi:hypothetical protein F4X86_04120 [Candidatus Saccharibacteria bacterium]|nr:hypothetical protein [Candidatus Saccharibacteria bacterium]
MSKPYTAVKKTNWGLYAIIATGAVAVLAVAGYAGISRGAGGPRIEINDASYTAYTSTHVTAERWKYVIRNDATCDGSIWSLEGRQGNYSEIVYGSNVYTPASKGEIAEHDGKYICFNALLTNGEWEQVGTRLNIINNDSATVTLPANWHELTDAEKIALNPYGCDLAFGSISIDLATGRCQVSLTGGPHVQDTNLRDVSFFLRGYISGTLAGNEDLVYGEAYGIFRDHVAEASFDEEGNPVDLGETCHSPQYSQSGEDLSEPVPAVLKPFYDSLDNRHDSHLESYHSVLLSHSVVAWLGDDGLTVTSYCKYDMPLIIQ